MKANMKFECGKYYWMQHKVEKIWRPVYVGQDNDGNLWMHQMGVLPIEISKMNLSRYKIKHLPIPK